MVRNAAGAALLMLTSCAPPPALAPDVTGLEAVAWLSGSWLTVGDGPVTEEHWGEPRAGTMMGTNRTIANGKTVHHEFLLIERTAQGLTLHAHPKGQAPASFPSRSITGTKVVFEAPEHDYPQRVIYEQRGVDGLYTRIEGDRDGEAASSDWHWRRVR